MSSFLRYLKEARLWVLTAIIALILLAIFYSLRSCGSGDLLAENEKLKKDKQALLSKLSELEKELNRPPEVKLVVKREKICVDYSGKEVPCGVSQAPAVEVTREMCCKLGWSIDMRNEYFFCKDEDICVSGNEEVGFTEKGKQLLKDIKTDIINIKNESIFKLSLLGGYDVFSSHFIAGLQFINWRSIGVGIDLSSDFKHFDLIRGGLFVAYRPHLFKGISNVGIGAGVSTQLAPFGKGTSIAGLVIFYVFDF